MAITAASIEANGWVLRLTLAGTPGSFASYALDPDGTPKVTLSSSHAGFAPSGGVAAATVLTRTIVATKPLRKPVNLAAPTAFVVDEVNNGDGTITVRLALSDFVHGTESALALAVAGGWRAGEATAAGIAVTNNSTFAAALPIMRWADLPYQRVTGGFTLELAVLSHHPQGLAPVAGVKFTVTDGTTVKTVWATALSTSTRYDDAPRVYAAAFDPAAAPALGAGLLRCDAEVYPWLGAMRSTDGAGTRSMTGLDVAGYGSSAATPLVVGYDPAATRYGGQVLFVDPVSGTTTAAAAMVKPDLVAAKAIVAASRPRDVTTALQALYLANRNLAAANGQAARSRSCDGARIVLATGVHAGLGATAVTSGLSAAEIGAVIEGDPDDAAPRLNCVLRTATSSSLRITKAALRNLTFEIGGTTLCAGTTAQWQFDNIEVRGKTGSETSTVAPFAATPAAGSYTLAATRTRWWKAGTGFSGVSLRFGLLRNCEWSRRADGLMLLGGRFIPAAEDSTVTGSINCTGAWNSATDITALEDIVITGCDLRGSNARAWVPVAVAAATAGTANPSLRRLAFVNNLCERIGSDPQPFFSMGEDTSATMSYNLIEGNSFVGERCNILYSDPLPTTPAEADSQLNQAFGNRVANNSFDWAATKHDAFDDPTTKAVRGSANGCRPQMVETWSITYGVGFEGNYDFGRHPSAGSFQFEYFGRRGVQVLAGVPAWPADRSTYGIPATGGGSYKPPAASPLVGRGRRAVSDRDRTGAARGLTFSTGSAETATSAVALVPANAVSASRATAALLVWTAGLVPAAARSPSTASAGRVDWLATLIAANSTVATRSSLGLLSANLLRVAASTLAVRDASAALLRPATGSGGAARTLHVTGDRRVAPVAAD